MTTDELREWVTGSQEMGKDPQEDRQEDEEMILYNIRVGAYWSVLADWRWKKSNTMNTVNLHNGIRAIPKW